MCVCVMPRPERIQTKHFLHMIMHAFDCLDKVIHVTHLSIEYIFSVLVVRFSAVF